MHGHRTWLGALVFLLAIGAAACREGDVAPCAGRPIQVGTLEDERVALETERIELDGCPGVRQLFVGECAASLTFVYRYNGRGTSEIRYFDGSGTFVAVTNQADAIDVTCGGRTYWPTLVECRDAVITEVICGTRFEVGQPFDVP